MIQLITASAGHFSPTPPFLVHSIEKWLCFPFLPLSGVSPVFFCPSSPIKVNGLSPSSLFPLLISSLPCQMTVVFCSSQTQTERATHRLIATKMIRLKVDPARGDIALYLSKEVKRTMPLRKYNAPSSFIKILMSDRPTLSST